jgi:replication factor C small subunit
MWSEKYRPKSLSEVVNQKEIVKAISNLVKSPDLPHMLFAGSAGVGKTTTALCIARELLGDDWPKNTLSLNASDERGIKMVRERVKEFAASIKLAGDKEFGKPKIIILDEADEMTSEAQTALRRGQCQHDPVHNCLQLPFADHRADTEQVRCVSVHATSKGRSSRAPEVDL